MLQIMLAARLSDGRPRRTWRLDRRVGRLCYLGIVFLAASPGLGTTRYVNNRLGDDANDGLSPEKALATIARAVQRAQTSDTISLANTGTAYREPIPLTRLGGTPAQPLVIEGNGATISGLRALPPERWTKVGEVYEFAGRKPYGFPYLVIDGQRVPPAAEPDKLPPGGWSWTADGKDRGQGVLRFRPAEGRTLADCTLEATLESSGLSVASASYIVVRNLTSEHHANDGFNVHGRITTRYAGRHDPAPVDQELVQVVRSPDSDIRDDVFVDKPPLIYSNRTAWYPRPSSEDFATGRMGFDTPAGWLAVTGGELVSSRTEGGRTRAEYRIDEPGKFITAIVGRLSEVGLRQEGEQAVRGVAPRLVTLGRQADAVEDVGMPVGDSRCVHRHRDTGRLYH